MMNEKWIKLAPAAEIRPGRAKFIIVGRRRLAIFHLAESGRYIVVDDECPHAGASLAMGEVQGETVTCPWHAWAFDLDTGRCQCAEHVWLRRYESRLEDGHIWARLPPPPRASDDASLMA
jgi:nitrite reductase (NADH) small subunit